MRTVALLLGNGFTQGFLVSQAVNHAIRCGVDDLLPAPHLEYQALPGDQFASGTPLWDPIKWPKLYQAHTDAGKPSASEFFKTLSASLINPDRAKRAFSMDTQSIAYELRCYLWHYFRSFGHLLNAHFGGEFPDWSRWSWHPLLELLLNKFRLSAISFNYDLVFEWAIQAFRDRGVFLGSIAEGPLQVLDALPINVIPWVKVHGTVDSSFDSALVRILGYTPNPWLRTFEFKDNIVQTPTCALESDRFPLVPDLVPPGHAGHHLCNPNSQVHAVSGAILARASLVIICGLSGEEPDSAEVQHLIDHIPGSSTILHVGLDSDMHSPLATMLGGHPSERCQFLHADRIFCEMPALIHAWFPSVSASIDAT